MSNPSTPVNVSPSDEYVSPCTTPPTTAPPSRIQSISCASWIPQSSGQVHHRPLLPELPRTTALYSSRSESPTNSAPHASGQVDRRPVPRREQHSAPVSSIFGGLSPLHPSAIPMHTYSTSPGLTLAQMQTISEREQHLAKLAKVEGVKGHTGMWASDEPPSFTNTRQVGSRVVIEVPVQNVFSQPQPINSLYHPITVGRGSTEQRPLSKHARNPSDDSRASRQNAQRRVGSSRLNSLQSSRPQSGSGYNFSDSEAEDENREHAMKDQPQGTIQQGLQRPVALSQYYRQSLSRDLHIPREIIDQTPGNSSRNQSLSQGETPITESNIEARSGTSAYLPPATPHRSSQDPKPSLSKLVIPTNNPVEGVMCRPLDEVIPEFSPITGGCRNVDTTTKVDADELKEVTRKPKLGRLREFWRKLKKKLLPQRPREYGRAKLQRSRESTAESSVRRSSQ